MSVGDNIKQLRKRANLTQKQLAFLAGVNEVTIRGYESGKYEPKTKTLYKLCRALECNINEITDAPFELPDYSFDDLEKITDNILVPKNFPNELKERLREQFSEDKLLKSNQQSAFLNYLDQLGYEFIDGALYDSIEPEIGMLQDKGNNIEIPLTREEFDRLEQSVKNDIEIEIYRLRMEKNI